MDWNGIATAVGDTLGREVTYKPIEIEEYIQQETEVGLPEQTLQHLRAVALDFQEGLFAGTDDVIETITGMPPMTVQSFVEAHRKELSV
jgi:NAD(P)H dehydrogenase (quinone)